MTNKMASIRWERTGPSAMGSADRAQRGVYAIMVNEALTGQRMTEDGMLMCPLTGKMFHVTNGEVDKANPALGYIPTNVCMVSKAGNQGRSALQQWHGDMKGAERYIFDVMRASHNVIVPLKKNAVVMWESCGRKGYEREVIAGPYGMA